MLLPPDIAERVKDLAKTLPCGWELVRDLVMMGLSDEEITRIGVEIHRSGLPEDTFRGLLGQMDAHRLVRQHSSLMTEMVLEKFNKVIIKRGNEHVR